jgi:hypothetical protein
MKVGIMQPYFFPYIGYWQLMSLVDKYVIYDDVNYIKGGWINRNQILMNGKPKMISLKMNGASPNKLINEVQVAKDEIYNRKLLRTIEHCYKKAPYYSDVFPLIEEIIYYKDLNLSLYLVNLITKVANYLDIKTEFIISSDIDKNKNLRGEDKVIEICRILNASEYYNAIGGMGLYSKKTFEFNGIKLKFLKTAEVEYVQYKENFIPNLSIIDVMMFNPKDDIKKLLSLYTID